VGAPSRDARDLAIINAWNADFGDGIQLAAGAS
jgi:hypothetical protein